MEVSGTPIISVKTLAASAARSRYSLAFLSPVACLASAFCFDSCAAPFWTAAKVNITDRPRLKTHLNIQNPPRLFLVIADLVRFIALYRITPLNNPDQHRNDGQDQQNVNEAAKRVRTHHSQQPQNQQQNKDRPKHFNPSRSQNGSMR